MAIRKVVKPVRQRPTDKLKKKKGKKTRKRKAKNVHRVRTRTMQYAKHFICFVSLKNFLNLKFKAYMRAKVNKRGAPLLGLVNFINIIVNVINIIDWQRLFTWLWRRLLHKLSHVSHYQQFFSELLRLTRTITLYNLVLITCQLRTKILSFKMLCHHNWTAIRK